MAKSYSEIVTEFKELIEDYVDNIFAFCSHELKLRLDEYNLLSRENNNVESSTAMGYLIEEFLVAKLSSFTKSKFRSKLLVEPAETPHLSYDCKCFFKDIKFLINIKCEKQGSANNGVAAINELYKDYTSNPDEVKSYIVAKVNYDYINSGDDRVIKINSYDYYSLEEIDFSQGWKQDSRSWSKEQNLNSGRLQVSNRTRRDQKMPDDKMSYKTTFDQITNIATTNSSSNS